MNKSLATSISKTVTISIALFVALFYAINLSNFAGGFEADLYTARMNSISNDRDLNLINNIPNEFNWIITTTDNVVDMHDWGAPLLWSNFHWFFSHLKAIIPMKTIEKVTDNLSYDFSHMIILLLNIMFFSLSIKFLYNESKNFNLKHHYLTTFLVIISTGALNQLLFNFDNADILAGTFTVFLITTILKYRNDQNLPFYFFLALGIILGYARTVKISYFTMLPLLLLLFFVNNITTKYTKIRQLAWISLGFISIYLMQITNNYITYGSSFTLFQGYEYAYSLEYLLNLNSYWRTFVGPGGIFLATPIVFLALLFFVYSLWKFRLKDFNLYFIYNVLFINVLAKFALASSAIVMGQQGYGLRLYSIDIFIFYFVISYALNSNYITLKIAIYLSALWAFINLLWWQSIYGIVEIYNAYYLFDFSKAWDQVTKASFNFLRLTSELPSFFRHHYGYLAVILVLILVYQVITSNYLKKSFIYSLATILFFNIAGLTFLNGYYNDKNSQKYFSRNNYMDFVVGNGMNIFLFHEVLSTMILGLEIDKIDKNFKQFSYRKKLFLNYYKKSKEEILWDGRNYKNSKLFNTYYFEGTYLKGLKEYQSLDYNTPIQIKPFY